MDKYLQIAPHIMPRDCPALYRPVIRHPDLQPNNIFVSNKLEIKGLIDWQYSTILLLFLQYLRYSTKSAELWRRDLVFIANPCFTKQFR